MNRKIYTKIYMKFEVTLKTQNNLAKKRTGRLTFHDFKTYWKATEIKIELY